MDKSIYDFNEIKHSIDMKSVLRFYGIDTKTRGNIACITGTHSDNRPSMKVGTNRCYCYACQASLSVIDVVMLKEGVDSKEAARILNDRYGLNLAPVHQVAYNDALPFSNAYIEALGLTNNPIVGVTKTYEDKDNAEKTEYKSLHYGLAELYADDKELYYDIIESKLNEKIEDTKAWEKNLKDEHIKALAFLSKVDIPNHLTDKGYLKEVNKSTYIVSEYYDEQMELLKTTKSKLNEMDRLLYAFYKAEIKPIRRKREKEDLEIDKESEEDLCR